MRGVGPLYNITIALHAVHEMLTAPQNVFGCPPSMRYLPTKSICEVNLSCSKKLQHDLEKEKRGLLLPGSADEVYPNLIVKKLEIAFKQSPPLLESGTEKGIAAVQFLRAAWQMDAHQTDGLCE